MVASTSDLLDASNRLINAVEIDELELVWQEIKNSHPQLKENYEGCKEFLLDGVGGSIALMSEKVFEEEGEVIEFGTIEGTDGAPGMLIKQGGRVIGIYLGNEERLKEMPNIFGKKVRITIENI